MEASGQRRYIGGFDGLRTLGVLGVILYHLRPDLFQGGYLGVLIFFVISGYLITDGLLRAHAQTGRFAVRKFWLKRIKRLYPALLTVLLAASAYIGLFARDLLVDLHKIVLANLALVYNWWQIAHGQSYFQRFAQNESPFTHLWTLSIEGQFYLLLPLLLWVLLKVLPKNRQRFAAVLTLALISAGWMAVLFHLQPAGADPSRLYYGTDTRIFALLLGTSLAFAWPSAKLASHLPSTGRWLLDGVGTLAVLGMGLSIFFMNAESAFLYQGGMFLFTVLALLLTAVVASPATLWGRLLSNPLFHWIGTRSYGLYIYQFPVMIFWENRFRNIADHPLLYPLIECAIIVLLSELSYHFIEKPARQLTWTQAQAHLRRQWQLFRQHHFRFKQVKLLTGLAIVLLGVAALVQAPFVKPQAAAPEEVHLKASEETKAQRKADETRAKNAIKAQASSQAQPSSQSTSATAAQSGVNASFERFGITQTALQAAQQVTVTAIGDSVLLGARPTLMQLMPNAFIDGKVARQMVDTIPLVKDYARQGLLADKVLIALGTNGSFRASDLAAMMQAIGPKRQVYWVNVQVPTRPWQGVVNQLLAKEAKDYPNLTIIDWHGYAKKHEDWFYHDLVHPNQVGVKYYAAYLTSALVLN